MKLMRTKKSCETLEQMKIGQLFHRFGMLDDYYCSNSNLLQLFASLSIHKLQPMLDHFHYKAIFLLGIEMNEIPIQSTIYHL